jgi:hypothetical protein
MKNSKENNKMQKSNDTTGGNKKIYTGPLGGKYVVVKCDGRTVKRYLKKKY